MADVATLANAAVGLAAITAAWSGHLALAYHLVFMGILVDGLDGAIARMGGGGGPLGHVIDTLADTVTFALAPAAIVLVAFGVDAWTASAAALFLFAGVLRLARFQNLPGGTLHFFGLSTPGAAMLAGTVTMLWARWEFAVAAYVAAAALMLTRWPVPKLRGPIGAAAVVVIATNLVLHFMDHPWQRLSLAAQLAFLALYFLAGPAYLKARAGIGGD